jgi:hypothetical protein
MDMIWLAIIFSVLTAAAFVVAIALGFNLADVRDGRARRAIESRAALAASIGALLLLVTVVLWISYAIFGPIHDAVREIVGTGD